MLVTNFPSSQVKLSTSKNTAQNTEDAALHSFTFFLNVLDIPWLPQCPIPSNHCFSTLFMPHNFCQTCCPVLDIPCCGFLTLSSSLLCFDKVGFIMVCDKTRRQLDKSELNKLLIQIDSMLLQIMTRIGKDSFLHSLNFSTSKLQA